MHSSILCCLSNRTVRNRRSKWRSVHIPEPQYRQKCTGPRFSDYRYQNFENIQISKVFSPPPAPRPRALHTRTTHPNAPLLLLDIDLNFWISDFSISESWVWGFGRFLSWIFTNRWFWGEDCEKLGRLITPKHHQWRVHDRYELF